MANDRDPIYHFRKEIFTRREPKFEKKKPHTMYPVVYEESADALQNIEWNAEGSDEEMEFLQ